jgi:type IV pilus assembly protein PilN
MAQFNLLPWKEQERQIQKIIFAATVGAFAVLALFFVILCHFYLYGALKYQEKRNSFLESELGQAQSFLADLEKQQAQEHVLIDEMHFIINLRDQNFQAVRLLDALAILTSSTISLTKVAREGNAVTVDGVALSDIEITLFMKNLAKSTIFEQPVLTGITEKKVGEIVQRSFQLKLLQRE